jgi:phosphatidylglycerophosphate synthase
VTGRRRSDELLELMKGGHLWTVLVNQRLGSRLGAALGDRGFTPNQLSVGNLLVGLASSAGVLGLVAAGAPVAAALVALVGWQLAYTFDCADGQLARATGKTTPEGFIIDLLCDYLVQASVVVVLVATAFPSLPEGRAGSLYAAAIVGTFLIGVFASALGTSTGIGHTASRSVVKEGIRTLFRDWGVQVLVYALAIGLGTPAVLVVVSLFSGVNVVFLVARLRRFLVHGMPSA